MILKCATGEIDWTHASEILIATVRRLNRMGKPLWTESQVSVEGLKKKYNINELFFFEEDAIKTGVVFLQRHDSLFWPEITDNESLFFHKLSIHPDYSGTNKGKTAIQLIMSYARDNGLGYVRMDCDIRPELQKFYQSNGFEYVDTRRVEPFTVTRYKQVVVK